MSEKTNGKTEDKNVLIQCSQIRADHAWNGRGGDWKNDETFKTLTDSIREKGQDDPVVVRKNPDPKAAAKHPWLLVKGFRRYEIALLLAAEKGEKNPTILARVKDLNDREALEENTRENCVRDNYRVPDVANVVKRMAADKMSDVAIAREIGKTQEYVSKLHRVIKNLDPALFEAWRKQAEPFSIRTVEAVAKKEKAADQKDVWKDLIEAENTRVAKQELLAAAKSGDEEAKEELNAQRDKAAYDACKVKARRIGELLGTIHGFGFQKITLDFSQCIEGLVKIPEDFDSKRRAVIANAATGAFNARIKEIARLEEERIEAEKAAKEKAKEEAKKAAAAAPVAS